MNSLQAIKRIKYALGMEIEEKLEAVAELVDGTKVHTDGELEIGAQLHVVADDGSMSPAPAGEHVTTDGNKITVDAAGVITSIEPAEVSVEVEAEKKEAEMAEIEVDTPIEGEVALEITEEVVQAVVDAIAPVVAEVAAIAEEMKKLKASFSKFSNEPSGQPVRNNFKREADEKVTLQEKRMEALIAIRKASKN